MSRIRWYIMRGNMYYAGANQWTENYYDRYLWYIKSPAKHIIFRLYADCVLVEEKY